MCWKRLSSSGRNDLERLGSHRINQARRTLRLLRITDEHLKRVVVLEFGQIKAEQALLTTKQVDSQRTGELGLTHSGRADEQKTANGPAGIVKTRFKQRDHLNNGIDRFTLANDPGPKPVSNFGDGPYVLARNDKSRKSGVDGEYLLDECGSHWLVLTDGAFFIQVVTDLSGEAQCRPRPGRSRQELAAEFE